MKYETSKIVNNELITVRIHLTDECKNGHQDFSITGSIYEAGKPLIEKHLMYGGCIHDRILRAFPKFKQFIDLHLSDYDGVPTYAVANMHYHLYAGFDNVKPSDSRFPAMYCEYYRVKPVEFDFLKIAGFETDKELFHYFIETLAIRARWKMQAKKAIKDLENFTGENFVNSSTRSNYTHLGVDKIEDIRLKIESGYYSPEARAIRANELHNKQKIDFFDNLDSNLEILIAKEKKEIDIKKQLYTAGGKKFVDSVIYYSHKNEIKCNWREYGEKLTNDEIKLIYETIKL